MENSCACTPKIKANTVIKTKETNAFTCISHEPSVSGGRKDVCRLQIGSDPLKHFIHYT